MPPSGNKRSPYTDRGRRSALLRELNKTAEANKEKLRKAISSARQWRLVNRPEHVRRSQLGAKLRKEAELESHSLGGALADPNFKSAGHAIQASLRAGAAALATKKEAAEKKAALLAARRKANANTLKKRKIDVELASEQEKSANKASREERNKAVKNAADKAAANKAATNKAAANKAAANKAAANKAVKNAADKAAANKAAEKERLLAVLQTNKLGMFNRRRITQLKNNADLQKALTEFNAKMKTAANTKAAANKATEKERLLAVLQTNKLGMFNRRRITQLKNNADLQKALTEFNAKMKTAANTKAAANNAKAAANAEKKAPNALKNYLVATVKPRYNKALVNAILKLPELNNNTRRRLQSPRMYALQRGTGALGRGAGALGNKARGFFSRSAAVPATGGGFFSRLFAPKPPPSFIPFKQGMKIPLGYVLKRNNKNNKALESQVEQRGYGPAPKSTGTTTGVSIGVGPSRYRNRYEYGNNYGNRYGNNRGGRGPGAPSGGIVFAPKINVGAARIGAQTFGGTRVGGQTMGGSRATTGNVGGTRVTTGNAGRLAVSAPATNGNRQLAATSEQLIRGAGGAEAVEQGIKALNAANGNVARAKATSKLPNNTFTNIYAMGGPVAAKRLVESRRRRRTVGGRRVGLRVASKKKRVAHKPKKQYIKLTPYQFRRLTDHIKKNNLRKVLIKEITH